MTKYDKMSSNPLWTVLVSFNAEEPHFGRVTEGNHPYRFNKTRRTCWSIACSASNPSGACRTSQATTIVITDNCPECKTKNNADFDIQARFISQRTQFPNSIS